MDDRLEFIKRQIVPLPRVGRSDYPRYPGAKRQGIIPGPRVGRSYWALDDDMHGMDRLINDPSSSNSGSATSGVSSSGSAAADGLSNMVRYY